MKNPSLGSAQVINPLTTNAKMFSDLSETLISYSSNKKKLFCMNFFSQMVTKIVKMLFFLNF